MNAEFNIWLLLVGLFVGAAIVWLIVSESSRRNAELGETELEREARWVEAVLADEGQPVRPGTAETILRLHRDYLAAPPPDGPDDLLAADMDGPGVSEARVAAAAVAWEADPAGAWDAEPAGDEWGTGPHRDWVEPDYSSPTSTGWPATESPTAGSSDTPKVAPDSSPETASESPAQ